LLASVFDGKVSATFVVLAGVGIALGTNSAIRNNDLSRLRMAQIKIAKRAMLLFIIGLSYVFYGRLLSLQRKAPTHKLKTKKFY
jgi:hypothetical protein